MRILAIRGQNMTSFENFELDLAGGPLAGAGLFAITGPVGAGKSTLLDAMSLALYDRTPRLGQKTRNKVLVGRPEQDQRKRLDAGDVRGVLRHGTAFAFAEVDFVGQDERRYQARWEVRRARYKASGKVQDQSMSLVDLDDGRRLGGTKTEVLAEIVNRVGLTFDQFRRSVLLPQGDFAAFLHAPARERAELLERMTGTAIYGRLSVSARERRLLEDRNLQELLALQQAQTVLSAEHRTDLENRLLVQAKELEKLAKTRDGARRACDWYEQSIKLEKDVATAAHRLEKARRQLAEQREHSRESATTFAELIEGEQLELNDALVSAERGAAEATDRLKARVALRPLVESWQTWELELRRFAHAAEEIETAEERLRELADRAAGLDAEHVKAVADKRRAFEALQVADKQKTECRRSLDGVDSARIRERREGLEQSVHDLERAQELEIEVVRLREESGGAQANVVTMSAELKALAAALEEARCAVRTAERVLGLEDLRSELESGEPCPLCGSEEHPWSEPGALELDKTLRDRASQLEADYVAMQRNVAALEQQIRDADAAAARSERRREELLAKTAGSVALEGLRAELEAVRVIEQRVEDLQSRLRKADLEQTKARDAFQAAEDQLRTVDKRRTKLHAEHVRGQDEVGRAGASQAKVVSALVKVLDGDFEIELRRNPRRFLQSKAAEVEEYRADELVAMEAQRRAGGLGQMRDKLAASEQDRSVLQNVVFLAELRALAAQFDERSTLVQLVSRELQRLESEATILQKLERQYEEMVVVQAERQRSLLKHRESSPPEMSIEDAMRQRERAESELLVTQEAFTELRATLRQDDTARERVAKLEPRLASQADRSRVWRSLDELIGSSDGARFRIFAQSLSLQVLLEQANLHLMELAPRYRLMAVPNTDLELQVMDLDMGEEIRGTKSLSGGETFLASLALALGLSSLSATSARVRSLFIDEGFGNLDPNALDTALASLDALQARGRQVGLISHVEGLGERIGVQVVVEPQGGGRSVLRTETVATDCEDAAAMEA